MIFSKLFLWVINFLNFICIKKEFLKKKLIKKLIIYTYIYIYIYIRWDKTNKVIPWAQKVGLK